MICKHLHGNYVLIWKWSLKQKTMRYNSVFRRQIQNKNKTHAIMLLIKHLKNIIKNMVDGV